MMMNHFTKGQVPLLRVKLLRAASSRWASTAKASRSRRRPLWRGRRRGPRTKRPLPPARLGRRSRSRSISSSRGTSSARRWRNDISWDTDYCEVPDDMVNLIVMNCYYGVCNEMQVIYFCIFFIYLKPYLPFIYIPHIDNLNLHIIGHAVFYVSRETFWLWDLQAIIGSWQKHLLWF